MSKTAKKKEVKAALAKIEVLQPIPEKRLMRGVGSDRNLLDPKLLQQISYEVKESVGNIKTRRPHVFIQSAVKDKQKLATYGFDM